MSRGDPNKAKGDVFMAEAEKALSKSSLGSIFGFGKTQKFQDAAESYVKAGNAYKLSNFYESAGAAFLKAAENYAQAENCQSDVVNQLVEAANNFKKCDAVRAIQVFQQAIDHYNDAGRFGMSGRYWKEVAEVRGASGLCGSGNIDRIEWEYGFGY
ncbi:MAG: hypothetical protein EOP84_26235 [Verrucomicrobiaceae bacterium]|nr:MAG: hypothetical protein EOP84_26235 [Verrucomicrobiaceae bacterium]